MDGKDQNMVSKRNVKSKKGKNWMTVFTIWVTMSTGEQKTIKVNGARWW